MSIIQKFILVSSVNVVSAIGILSVIKALRRRYCFIKCTTAIAPDEKQPGIVINMLDVITRILQRLRTNLKNR